MTATALAEINRRRAICWLSGDLYRVCMRGLTAFVVTFAIICGALFAVHASALALGKSKTITAEQAASLYED